MNEIETLKSLIKSDINLDDIETEDQLIKAGFEYFDESGYLGYLLKARDISKLTKKIITDKRGHRRIVYVRTDKESRGERLGQLKQKYRGEEISAPQSKSSSKEDKPESDLSHIPKELHEFAKIALNGKSTKEQISEVRTIKGENVREAAATFGDKYLEGNSQEQAWDKFKQDVLSGKKSEKSSKDEKNEINDKPYKPSKEEKQKYAKELNETNSYYPLRTINFGVLPKFMPLNARHKLNSVDFNMGDIGIKLNKLETQSLPKNIKKDVDTKIWRTKQNKKIKDIKSKLTELRKKGREIKKQYSLYKADIESIDNSWLIPLMRVGQ